MIPLCVLLLAGPPLQSPEHAFTVPEPGLVPEGIAHDPVDDVFYVGSTYRRKIVRVRRDGEVSDFAGGPSAGLWGVVGMQVDRERRLLWAASSHAGSGMPMSEMNPDEEGSSGLFAFRLDSGERAYRLVLEGEHFLNDVVVTPSGDVLVTDSRTGVVYIAELETGELSPFAELVELGSPNGITTSPDGGTVFVAVGPDVAAVDATERSIRHVGRPEEHKGVIDGLYFFHGSLIAVQPFVEGAYVVRLVLGPDFRSVERAEPLVTGHPALSQPTTGAIAGSELYFIANSQLQVFRRLWNQSPETAPEHTSLIDPIVLRIRIPLPPS